MLASDSSDDGVTTSLLGKRAASPPMAMRSSKSAISQVRSTLFSFIKRPKVDSQKTEDKYLKSADNETKLSVSEKQRMMEAFSDRLMSFSVTNWMGKPLCLSPPLLAQYGWQCIGVDTIKCCSCSAVICIRLPWPTAENYRIQCYKFRQKLITSHMKICSWPSYPCSDSFVSPFLHGAQDIPEIVSSFFQRRRNLIKLADKLPKMNRNILSELKLQCNDLQAMLQASEVTSSDVESSSDHSTYLSLSECCSVLALCGWDTADDTSSKAPVLYCGSSGKTIRLRNFFSLYNEAQSNGESDNDCHSPQKLLGATSSEGPDSISPLKITKKYFHPLEQHVPWSHWIVTLKPISKDEFDDIAEDNYESDELFQYIINPFVKGALPGWHVVTNALLGRKSVTEKATDSEVVPSDSDSTSQQPQDEVIMPSTNIKSPPRSVVAHVRKLMKEWSSAKS